MTIGHESSDAGSKPSLGSLIEQICVQFESKLNGGSQPRIEEFLDQAPLEIRPAVLRKLLILEMERAMAGPQRPDPRQWIERFPAQEAMINSIWNESNQAQETRPLSEQDKTMLDSVCTATRYRGLRHFRTGGMAELLLAHDEELGRDTVVKRLRQRYRDDPECVAQLSVEAEITGRLDHPGIVPVYGIGQGWDGQPFYVMRKIQGTDLQASIAEYHEKGGPGNPSPENRKRLFTLLEHLISACNTVAYAHDAGIVHCDLKPLNIMIGRYGETFVVDWGLARGFSRSTEFRRANEPSVLPKGNSSKDVHGFTPGYVSPEQYAGQGEIQPASDIYSLGATLYHILTNRTQLAGSEHDASQWLRPGGIVSPRKIFPAIPKPLEAICLKAMHSSPSSRHGTAKQLAADLRDWMHDEEIDSFPDGRTARVLRWARHHRAATMATLVTTIVLLLAAVTIGAGVRHVAFADQMRRKAEVRFDAALATFEQLSTPLANEEKNNLDTFKPLAENIVTFADNFLDDPEVTGARSLQLARILELRASANGMLSPDKAALLKDLQGAESIYRELLAKEPEDAQYAWRLDCNHLMQGRLLIYLSDFAAAEPLLKEALRGFQALQKSPAPPVEIFVLSRREAETQHALGELYLDLASTNGDESSYSRSADHFLRSRAIREKLVEQVAGHDRNDQETIQRDLARSYGYLGDLYLRRGDVVQAEDEYQRSLKLRSTLFQSNPVDPEHRFQYARGLSNFGVLEQVERRDPSRALERLEEARQVQESLNQDFPGNPDFGLDLASTLNMLAEMRLFLAADAQAAPAKAENLRKAVRLTRDARIVFNSLSKDDPLVIRGAALSSALQAETLQDSDPEQAAKLANQAEQKLSGLEGAPDQDDYFTQALINAVLNRKDEALEDIGSAVQKGSNTVQRFRSHLQLGLRVLANDPEYREELEKWIEKAQERITVR